jgi:hypothetical protein
LVVVLTGSVVTVPLVGCLPLQPPVAVQLCALLTFHVSVATLPGSTVDLATANVIEGVAEAVELALLALVPTEAMELSPPHAARAAAATETSNRLNRRAPVERPEERLWWRAMGVRIFIRTAVLIAGAFDANCRGKPTTPMCGIPHV